MSVLDNGSCQTCSQSLKLQIWESSFVDTRLLNWALNASRLAHLQMSEVAGLLSTGVLLKER